MRAFFVFAIATTMGEREVTVNVTPDGWADAVKLCNLATDPPVPSLPSHLLSPGSNYECQGGALLGWYLNVTVDWFQGAAAVRRFVQGEERSMAFGSFVEAAQGCPQGGQPQRGAAGAGCEGVFYLSAQNDSLRSEFEPLTAELPASVDWAAAAFGTEPDAVNLWVGDQR